MFAVEMNLASNIIAKINVSLYLYFTSIELQNFNNCENRVF